MGVTFHIDSIDPSFIETLTSCPYCSSTNWTHLFTENGFPHQECQNCKLIFLNKRVKRENLDIIYGDSSYHPIAAPEYHLMIGKKRLGLFSDLPKGARIHEDGAGAGFFVAAARERGFQITGSDLGQDAIDKAKQFFDVELKKGLIGDIGIEQESLDAFAAFNLFSHLYEPWDYIKEVSTLLKPGGQFLTRMGDRSGFFKLFRKGKFGAPEHVFHFGVDLITEYYEAAGLEVIKKWPAFDSDFPYLFFDYSQKHNGLTGKLARKACSLSVKAWNALKLPKEDIYLLARKK